jgi:hypothetical protein
MDLVLGLSITSTVVRWVLVDGTTGEGAPIDRGARDVATAFDVDGLLDELYVAEGRIHAVGVTWTRDAEDVASGVLQALSARGLDNVVAVSEIEAADALASGIADIAGYDDVAVCVVEPDAAVVALVDAGGVNVERIGRPLDGDDAVELTSSLLTVLDLNDRRPDAIFVLGSVDLDLIVASLAATGSSPVISAAEADFALARGAALASAQAVNTLDGEAATPRHRISRTGALTSVLVAAVVTFVISLSVALGLRLGPNSDRPEMANAAGEPAPAAAAPSVAQAAPRTPLLAAPELPTPEAPPLLAKTMVVAAPPPPVPEAVPAPAPAYVPPPAPPAYVPPPPPPQPRLRDRIIEHIPIIGRFHQPQ